MILVIAVLGALAAGYCAGHYRLPQRLFDYAYGFAASDPKRHCPGWFAAEAVSAVMLAGALLVHPRRTARRIREHRHPRPPGPAPDIDPNWGRR